MPLSIRVLVNIYGRISQHLSTFCGVRKVKMILLVYIQIVGDFSYAV